MILAVVICFALLVVILGMFLLAKTRSENLGKFFGFVSYFVIVFGFVMILFALQAALFQCIMHHKYERECMRDNLIMRHEPMDGVFEKKICIVDDFDDEKENMAYIHKEKMKCCHDMENMPPKERAEMALKMLTEKLKLKDDQVPRVHEVILKYFDLKESTGGDMEKLDKIQKEKLDALKKILTPEQFKNLPECCFKK
ncbi:MAG: hypothetical protein HY958_11465 [Bacteroidia bacterium]|nr:hypothetical protein [Bacteroidia bacterium]